MTAVSVSAAKEMLLSLLANVNDNDEAITITNNNGKNAVLISEDEWKSIQETLYLSSIPGLVESITDARNEPIEECIVYDKDEEW